MSDENALSGRQERAAGLLAEDRLADAEIAAILGISPRTIDRWKRDPAVAARVAAIRAEIAAAVVAEGIADRRNRVDALNDRWRRMHQVIAARAADPTMATTPGGPTGLLVRRYKSIGSGPTATMVEEYEADTPLLAELRAHERQAAQELGQWVEKQEHAGKGGGPLVFTLEIDRRGPAEERDAE